MKKTDLEYIDSVPVDKEGRIFLGMTKGGLHLAFKKLSKDEIDVLETASHPGVLKFKLKKMGINIMAKSAYQGPNCVSEYTGYNGLSNNIQVYAMKEPTGETFLRIESPEEAYEIRKGSLMKKEIPLQIRQLAYLLDIIETV